MGSFQSKNEQNRYVFIKKLIDFLRTFNNGGYWFKQEFDKLNDSVKDNELNVRVVVVKSNMSLDG